MKVLVLGAGVVGVTTAYYLWRDGHEVTVLDRQAGPGFETSFGNAGGLCPSFAGPWAAPGMVSKVLKMSLQGDSPIRFSLKPEIRKLQWLRLWLANCNTESFRVNKLRMQKVAHYSMACLKDLVDSTALTGFDFHADGVLQLFRTAAELEMGHASARALAEFGVPWRMLDAAGLNLVEPSLAHSTVGVAGALHLPLDASGDSHRFVLSLGAWLEARGVSFLYNTAVEAIAHDAGAITGVRTATTAAGASSLLQSDAYVVALGSYAPLMLAPLGIRLPIYPLKGYSITVPVTDEALAPRAAIMDEHNKVMISRLGNRIRAAGMAELTGYDLSLVPSRKDLLVRVVREIFPRGLDFDQVSFWAGLRPMTPDGPPILGKTRWPNLFLNSGHGSNGWTQACGTSRIVADVVSGKGPDIDIEGLTAGRFGAG
ncbi:D-amino acid dehydrogenase [Polaromonas sp.]|uniref:D-amino acid dehydrogenase n=1 Tax=Polaromonas sp. TaxID=1869339 RepID=UPI003BA93571